MNINWVERLLDFLFSPSIVDRVSLPSRERYEQLGFCVNCDATRIIDRVGRCINCGSGSVLQEGSVRKFSEIRRAHEIKSYRRGKLNLVYSREAKLK